MVNKTAVKIVEPKGTGSIVLFFFFNDLICLFLERGEGREKEWERNISVWLPLVYPSPGTWPATQACALTGNRTGDPLIHRPALSPEPHQPGLSFFGTALLRYN